MGIGVPDLGNRLEVAEYRPDKDGQATVRLVNGILEITIPYQFYAVSGSSTPIVNVIGEATVQQLADLKTILVAILQATNAEIESQHGWTKYVEPAGP